jgi:hypothetical protein
MLGILALAGVAAAVSSISGSDLSGTAQPLFVPSFTQNQGQWPDSICYRTRFPGVTAWFAANKVHYQFTRSSQSAAKRPHSLQSPTPDTAETQILTFSFLNSKPSAYPQAEELIPYYCNYFLGKDSAKWASHVSNFKEVDFKRLYEGIDVAFYFRGRQLEHDFVVDAGADPSQIMVRVDGAEQLRIDAKGNLVIQSRLGTLTQDLPAIYQYSNGTKSLLTASLVLVDSNTYSFRLGSDYQPEFALVIDPIMHFSTLLGGSGAREVGASIAVDKFGSPYITGTTASVDFPLVNPIDSSYNGGLRDVFVAKFSPLGNVEFCTYLGGSYDDQSYGIAVDKDCNAYVGGGTSSSDFPLVDPIQSSYSDYDPYSYGDAFVVKLSPQGDRIIFGTLWGGTLRDLAWDIAVDTAGQAYLYGQTMSPSFPCANCQGGSTADSMNAFVAKFAADGHSDIYSRIFGGGDDADEFGGIAVDQTGCAFIVGRTWGHHFPLVHPIDTRQPTTQPRGYIIKFSASGQDILYSSFFGGTAGSLPRDIALDSSGNIYMTGATSSDDFPTVNAFQKTQSTGWDGFLSKLSGDGQTIIYSTYFRGVRPLANDGDEFLGLAIDKHGAAYVAGYTLSGDIPMINPYQGVRRGFDGATVLVVKFAPAGNTLEYSTYVGGAISEVARGIAIDDHGNAFVTGATASPDFPFVNAVDTTLDTDTTLLFGDEDAFVFRLGDDATDVQEPDRSELSQMVTLNQNYPNPFNPSTTIEFELPCREAVHLEVFNVRGQSVRTLVDEIRSAGHCAVEWKGDNARGEKVSSGVYLYRLTAGLCVMSKKMLLIK